MFLAEMAIANIFLGVIITTVVVAAYYICTIPDAEDASVEEGFDAVPYDGMVDDSRAADHFADEIGILIERMRLEYSLTYSEAIGVLELAKADIIEEARHA